MRRPPQKGGAFPPPIFIILGPPGGGFNAIPGGFPRETPPLFFGRGVFYGLFPRAPKNFIIGGEGRVKRVTPFGVGGGKI